MIRTEAWASVLYLGSNWPRYGAAVAVRIACCNKALLVSRLSCRSIRSRKKQTALQYKECDVTEVNIKRRSSDT